MVHVEHAKDSSKDPLNIYQTTRIIFSKVVTTITMCDETMVQMANDTRFIFKFLEWMNSGLSSSAARSEESIRMAGALCIGNFARSGTLLVNVDDTCATLLFDKKVGEPLIALLRAETERFATSDRTRDENKSSIKVFHAIIAGLKNLSLARIY